MSSFNVLTDPFFSLLTIALIVAISGFVQSSIGFGYAITALAIMPMVLEPRASHIVISLSGLPVLLMTACSYGLSLEWAEIKRTLLGAMLLLPIGLLLFAHLPQQLLSQATGVTILLFVLLDYFKKNQQADTPPPHWLSYLAGAVSGFLAGAVSIGGPPVATYALRRGWSPATFKSFVSSCLLLIAVLKILGLFIGGFFLQDDLFHALWAVPFAIGGVLLGTAVSQFIKPELFRRLIAIALIAAASNLIWNGSRTVSDSLTINNGSHLANPVDRYLMLCQSSKSGGHESDHHPGKLGLTEHEPGLFLSRWAI